ncbi:MAG: GIN domain-containing protein, partial [Vicinamibacterales bacterium]
MTTGSGHLTTETRPLDSWNAVALGCPGTLDLQIGANEGIWIEAEDNILPLIETVVDGGRLRIRFADRLGRIKPTMPIRFRAATPAIDAIVVSGSGQARAPLIVRERLALD